MEIFAKEQDIKCYKEGDGIEHVVLIEDGYIVPGSIILGTDSHTDTNGALNSLAFGIGTTDGSYAMATGSIYDFDVPETIRINMHGQLNKGVYSKDLILFLIGRLGVDGAVKRVVEFGGPALKNLSMDSRTTIANMAVEMGARTAIFEPDDILEDYLKDRAKFNYKTYLPDENCNYEKVLDIDLSSLEPTVAFPHKPGNVTFISKSKEYMKKTAKNPTVDSPKVETLRITDAFLGACTNGRYEDLVEASKILKGRKVNPNTNFIVIPASRKVYNQLLKEGVLQIFADAGANIESSNCGPCFGKHMGIVGKGAQMISSSNRNYIGRMGSKDAKIFLASPVTVAAAAITGKIVDPREYL
jgi:3-isopropylmalate/(R)-2-methylmalate dehydratase large subunit